MTVRALLWLCLVGLAMWALVVYGAVAFAGQVTP